MITSGVCELNFAQLLLRCDIVLILQKLYAKGPILTLDSDSSDSIYNFKKSSNSSNQIKIDEIKVLCEFGWGHKPKMGL